MQCQGCGASLLDPAGRCQYCGRAMSMLPMTVLHPRLTIEQRAELREQWMRLHEGPQCRLIEIPPPTEEMRR